MSDEAQNGTHEKTISRKARIAILIVFGIIGAGAIALTVWSVLTIPKNDKPGVQTGVGADGFHAFVEDNGNLNVGSVANKNQVITALGSYAKSTGEGSVSNVFNLNGNQGQTLTFSFVRADGANSSLYIDKRIYKSAQALRDDHIYTDTLNGGMVKGRNMYFRSAQTIGRYREYHLMVVNGTTVYRFVISQPYDNITISEIEALAILKKLALEANL